MSLPFKQQIAAFAKQLAAIDVSGLQLSGYPLQYFELLANNSTYYLHIYADVLQKVVENSTKRKEEIILVDYGAGNGLLGMFAKFVGFRKVYLVDVSETFIDAAIRLDEALKTNIDAFIVGDFATLLEYCSTAEVPDAIVGTDVIEHIYNLDHFFKGIKSLNNDMVTVFTTASVTANPVKNRALKQLQYNDENVASNASHATEDNEYAGLSFLEIRKRLIKKHFIFFDKKMVDEMAVATRGMNEADIIAACSNYFIRKEKPKPTHPTNTCDPVTGSWTERLLTVKEYKSIYDKAGFSLTVFNGFYNEWQRSSKGKLLRVLNKTTALLGKQGRFVSSYIVLVGGKL